MKQIVAVGRTACGHLQAQGVDIALALVAQLLSASA